MLWSSSVCVCVCIEDQSPPASAMVMNGVCTCLPVQLSVVRRASCVGPASTEIDRGTHMCSSTDWTMKSLQQPLLQEDFRDVSVALCHFGVERVEVAHCLQVYKALSPVLSDSDHFPPIQLNCLNSTACASLRRSSSNAVRFDSAHCCFVKSGTAAYSIHLTGNHARPSVWLPVVQATLKLLTQSSLGNIWACSCTIIQWKIVTLRGSPVCFYLIADKWLGRFGAIVTAKVQQLGPRGLKRGQLAVLIVQNRKSIGSFLCKTPLYSSISKQCKHALCSVANFTGFKPLPHIAIWRVKRCRVQSELPPVSWCKLKSAVKAHSFHLVYPSCINWTWCLQYV